MSELLKTSLVYLKRENQVLLAMKKRGFGVGLWNGIGGKMDPGETMEETAVRECQEEILVTPLELSFGGLLSFYFAPDGPIADKNQCAYTYFCSEWEGVPTETEEMGPEWFDDDKIPYDQMWLYNKLSLPRMLSGERIIAEFHHDADNLVIAHEIKPLYCQ